MTQQKILLVEDDMMLSSLLERELANSGYEVHAVHDGEAAVKEAEVFLPNLILLDMLLPKKDGFGVLKDLKDIHMTQDIPVIVLSNLGKTEDIDKATKGGAAAYLVKINHSPKEVVEKVKAFLAETPSPDA